MNRSIFRSAFLGLVVALGICILCVCGFLALQLKTVRLPSGAELTLAAVTQGRTNMYVPGGVWNKLITRLAPKQGITVGKFAITPTPAIDDTCRTESGRIAHPSKRTAWLRH